MSVSEAKRLWELAVSIKAILRDAIPQAGRKLKRADGTQWIDFATTGYLGLEFDPRVMQAFQKAVTDHGVYQYCSPIYMRPPVQQELEELLAEVTGYEAAMVFTNVTALHAGVVPLLSRVHDPMIADEFAHQSIHDSLKLVRRTETGKFRHNNPKILAHTLEKLQSKRQSKTALVLTDGVFSMSGLKLPFDVIAPVVAQYGGTMYVDDSHGFGILGKNGSGVSQECHNCGCNAIYVGSLGKSMPSPGGFIAASKELIETIRYQANTGLFSGNVPYPYLRSALTALQISASEEGDKKRASLYENSLRIRNGLNDMGLTTLHDGPATGVVVSELTDAALFEKLCVTLHSNHVAFNPVMFPAVPMGKYRMRFCISANHTADDVDTVLKHLKKATTK